MSTENEPTRRRASDGPWWRSGQVLWIAATLASLVIIAVVVVAGGHSDDEPVATATEPVEVAPEETAAAPSATPAPSPTATPAPPASIIGPPADALWPNIETTPLEDWPTTPGDAATHFVAALTGYDLPIGAVAEVENEPLTSQVSLHSVGEDGQPFGEATVVTVVGGVDRTGTRHWGVRSAESALIRVDAWSFSEPPVAWQPSGEGLAFEGTVTTQISTSDMEVIGLYYVSGGGVEMAPLSGAVPITPTAGGPGFAALYDVGGLGTAPTALTVVPIEIPAVAAADTEEPKDGVACSAAALELSNEALQSLVPSGTAEGGDEAEVEVEALPAAVVDTRRLIVEAAVACDYQGLAALISPAGFSFSFGSGADPIEYWQELEAEGEDQPTRRLVETLLLPHGVETLGDEPLYVWPDAFLVDWDQTTEAQRAALAEIYDSETLDGWESFGAFIGYRLGITESGDWIYFIAGD